MKYQQALTFIRADATQEELHMLNKAIIETLKDRRRRALGNFSVAQEVEFTITGKRGKKARYNGLWRGTITSIGQLNAKVLASKVDGTISAMTWTVGAGILRTSMRQAPTAPVANDISRKFRS